MAMNGVNIIEKYHCNRILWSWSFPTVSQSQRDWALRKFSELDENEAFACFRQKDDWCFIYSSATFQSDILDKVKQCGLLIWSSEYNITKYKALCRILSERYCKTGDPTIVLQLYLSVLTTGVCDNEENGSFIARQFNSPSECDNKQIRDLISLFGLETILIYTALLLKKRMFVYDHNLTIVLQVVDAASRLLLHRKNSNIIYPWVHIVSDEIADLKAHNGYIAGSVDSSIGSKTELYDILVNVAAREVVISPGSRDAFIMTKTHKDIAVFLVQLAEMKNLDIPQEIAKKTDDLLAQLRLLATTETPDGHKMMSIENLRERQFPQQLENFLFNLAVAENIMLL